MFDNCLFQKIKPFSEVKNLTSEKGSSVGTNFFFVGIETITIIRKHLNTLAPFNPFDFFFTLFFTKRIYLLDRMSAERSHDVGETRCSV